MLLPIAVLYLITYHVPRMRGAPSEGATGFRINRNQQVQFGEGIRDWFEDVRDRVVGQQSDTVLRKVLGLDNGQLQKNRTEQLLLDLSTLTFNPERDWGFHIGHWYFVRKEDTNYDDFNDAGKWELAHPSSPQSTDANDWVESDDRKGTGMTFPSITTVTEPTGSIRAELARKEPSVASKMAGGVKEADEDSENNGEFVTPVADIVVSSSEMSKENLKQWKDPFHG